MEFLIKGYDGGNKNIVLLKKYLEKNIANKIKAVIIHGSYGTGEQIKYSDFDGLIIFNEKIKKIQSFEKIEQKILKKSLKLIYKIDPLQHHGWFFINESDLREYPEHYLPSVVLNYSKSLIPSEGIKLDIISNFNKKEYQEAFYTLCMGLENQIIEERYPHNIYTLKGFLSRFMLLPSLYIQARDNKGIFKKNSFDVAKNDFTESIWSIMEEVSIIRKNWDYKMNTLHRFILTRNTRLRFYLARRFAPRIPESIQIFLTADFYLRIRTFITEMKKKLNETPFH